MSGRGVGVEARSAPAGPLVMLLPAASRLSSGAHPSTALDSHEVRRGSSLRTTNYRRRLTVGATGVARVRAPRMTSLQARVLEVAPRRRHALQ